MIMVVSPFSMLVYHKKQKGFFETSEQRVLKCFVDNGHEVHLLVPREVGNPQDFLHSGIFVHEFKMPYVRLTKSLMSRVMGTIFYYFQYLLFILLSIRKFMSVTKIYGKPDVTYGYAPQGCLAAYMLSRLLRLVDISRLFGIIAFYTYLSRPLRFILGHFCFELFAFKLPCRYLIITNDGTRGDEVAKRLKVPTERVKYWMNGVDFLKDSNVDAQKLREELGIDPQARVIVSICRLRWLKRVDRLIRALPLITSVHSNVKLLIIGEGEERETLERLTDILGVRRFVSFLGAVPHRDVEKYLHASDLFVSLYDFSNVSSSLLEAMACGLCVVALNSGTTCQIISNGKNGILIDYDDLEKLPTLISRLLKNDDLRRKLGNNAREYALKNFKSWNERVKMEVELIEDLFK